MYSDYPGGQPDDIFDRIMGLPLLRRFYGIYRKKKDVLLYLFFGVLTTAVSIGSFALASRSFGINELISNVISWICAVSFAYLTNRTWVFHSSVRGKAVWKEAASFFSGRLITLGIEELMLLVFVTLLKLDGLVIKIAAQFVVLVLNYVISKWLIFRTPKK